MSREVCDHLRPVDGPCALCDDLAKAHHAIHVKTILHSAWDRVGALPIIKSMHPDTRRSIFLAIVGE